MHESSFPFAPEEPTTNCESVEFSDSDFDISLESIWLMGNNGPLCTFPIPVCMIRGSNRNEIERFVRELSGNKDMEWSALHRHS